MKQWFALHTKPRSEKRVACALGQAGIETFLPMLTSPGPEGNQVIMPFFPTYLFMRVDMGADNNSSWRWTPGLRYAVGYGDHPVPIPDEVIRLIRHRLAERANAASNTTSQFEPGDLVKIKDGPFGGMLAVFERPSSPGDRVSILISTLGSAVRVRLAADNLEDAARTRRLQTGRRPRRTRGRGRRVN